MSDLDTLTSQITELIGELKASEARFAELFEENERQNELILGNEKIIRSLTKERRVGFPTLAYAFEQFDELQDKNLIDFLTHKDKPAIRASEVVSEYGKIRRRAERENRILRNVLHYYEEIAPFLVDERVEVEEYDQEEQDILAEYSDEEKEDTVTRFITKGEYRNLSTTERNQLALDRYWKRPKSRWHIGKIYERYVGYLHEIEGFKVNYHGIHQGYEDLGRDILARKGKRLIIIQCKNWSKFKTIYENHIFQFFGTVFQYKDQNKSDHVEAVFYATTALSDIARRFAQELGIHLVENDVIPKTYPCIKCNISERTQERIYHLPFDQQYDNVQIEIQKGEAYAKTVLEAEKMGFRRAFRYKKISSSQ